MAVVFLPFATSVLAGALRSGHGQRTAVVFYAAAHWQHPFRQSLRHASQAEGSWLGHWFGMTPEC